MTQPDAGTVPPDDDMTSDSTDAEADARRSGADDERHSNLGEALSPAVDPGQGTDDGVPVGRADADADRMGSVEDDDRG
jgi:hypothetical protein